jgi:hypothetical protein
MRFARIVWPLAVLLAISVIALIWWSTSGPLTALVQVLDADGNPVKGATIRPDGLRHKGPSSGHFAWDARYSHGIPPRTVTTDQEGTARITYPRYVHEKLETREVSMLVEHPDFPSERPFITVDETPPAKEGLWGKLQGVGIAAY